MMTVKMGDPTAAICPGTSIRREACACGICGLHATAQAKYAANRRDARALLYLIADNLKCYRRYNVVSARWDDVSLIADLRRRLMEIAVAMGGPPDGGEQTRRRLEEALGTEGSDLDEALLRAM